MATLRDTGWALFDRIVAQAPLRDVNPWRVVDPVASSSPPAAPPSAIAMSAARSPWPGLPWAREGVAFEPDYATLELLLGVPVLLQATSQSGVPALALDVWVAYEFRRAGFDPDRVWPRASEPRVIPTEVMDFVRSLPRREQALLLGRIASGQGGAKSANVLGKNYVKQVDVVMSSWATGPELMVSTKRMDSSFGKNAANRVEESYGDAKNLRSRHPQAALGFVYALSAVALTSESDTAAWLIDLLGKLGREGDAYDAVALVMPDLSRDQESPGEDPPEPAGPLEAGVPGFDLDRDVDPTRAVGPADGSGQVGDAGRGAALPGPVGDPSAVGSAGAGGTFSPGIAALFGDIEREPASPALPGLGGPGGAEVDALSSALRPVRLRQDAVPPDLNPSRFFEVMGRRVLDGSPVNFHAEARRRLAHPRE